MDRRINKLIADHTSKTKDGIKQRVLAAKEEINAATNHTNVAGVEKSLMSLLQFVLDSEPLTVTPADYVKRKRTKNTIPLYDMCSALKADGTRCSRRKREGEHYCGTHTKGTPYGSISGEAIGGEGVESETAEAVVVHGQEPLEKSAADAAGHGKSSPELTHEGQSGRYQAETVWLEDIKGILHYIDKHGNVYKNEDIIENKKNPKIIAKYDRALTNGEWVYSIVAQ
jgi:hypothetical protein